MQYVIYEPQGTPVEMEGSNIKYTFWDNAQTIQIYRNKKYQEEGYSNFEQKQA